MLKRQKNMKLALGILTFNRVLDAKLQMRLVRNVWAQEPGLRDVKIYHLYNGKQNWYAQKHLEDELIRTENPGHLEGANLLLNLGVERILKEVNPDYILFASADVWLVRPHKLAQILAKMEKEGFWLATSLWFLPNAYSTEFFVIKRELAEKVFPFNIYSYRQTHKFTDSLMRNFPVLPIVEMSFFGKVKEVLSSLGEKRKRILLLPGREFVFYPYRRYYSQSLGFLSDHNLDRKKEILAQYLPVAKTWPEFSEV
jgi:hypothetical protein